jgi:hypothetical protein
VFLLESAHQQQLQYAGLLFLAGGGREKRALQHFSSTYNCFYLCAARPSVSMLSDSDDEMSHTSLCNMSVEPARKPAFVSFLCVTWSYASSTGHAVASTKAY